MKYSFFLAPSGRSVGLTSVSLGLVRALDREGLRVGFCKPIAQHANEQSVSEPSLSFLKKTYDIVPPEPISLSYTQDKVAQGNIDQLMEDVVDVCKRAAEGVDILVIEGLVRKDAAPFFSRINDKIVTTLDSGVILVTAQHDQSPEEFNRRISMSANFYGGTDGKKVLGCILNKVGAPIEPTLPLADDKSDDVPTDIGDLPVFSRGNFRCLGSIPWDENLIAPRIMDVVRHLSATSINTHGDMMRRIKNVTICARTVANSLGSLTADTLVVFPGDRDDMLLATCMAALNGVPIAGLLLTGGYTPSGALLDLCHTAFLSGLPILSVQSDTISTAKAIDRMNLDVPSDDIPRIERVMNSVADSLDAEWLVQHARIARHERLSPAAFRHQLVSLSSANAKRIVLPEGDEPRTIRAAVICHEKGIAQCVLLGNPELIRLTAEKNSLELPEDIRIVEPASIRDQYIEPLVKMREHKGLNAVMAEAQLEDPVVLGTVMLAVGDVDGLVSGAVNTTANTIRPALQLIKTSEDAKLVSSVFFMCLPEQVVVYGDCAVNPDPSAEELADIAIQSGDSAKAFGIEPRIAMISYSTGESGMGSDVEKVREATEIVKSLRPDLLVDGPLQYDAASVASVAAKKAPNSPVAGKATVFVFPDLNTGNTTYKAVQRSANVVSVGPMLQGLNKPVNDLSRGALVDDIVYTIALTAIQAGQK